MNDLATPTLEAPAPPVVTLDGEGDVSMNDLIDNLVKEQNGEPGGETPGDEGAKPAPKAETEEEVDEDDGIDDEHDEKRKKALSKEGKLEEERLEKAFIKLRQQERRGKERAIANENDKKAIIAARQEYDQRVQQFNAEYQPLLKLARENPIEFLAKAGWDKAKVADWIVNDNKLPPERLIAEADQRMREQTEALDRRQTEFEERQAQAQLQGKAREYEATVFSQVSHMASSGEYPLTLAMAKVDAGENGDVNQTIAAAVKNYCAKVYKETGKALAPVAAMRYFEQRLARQKEALGGGAPAQGGAGKTAGQPGAGQPRLLTNNDTSERNATSHTVATGDDDDDSRWKAVDKLLADANRGVFPEG